MDWIDNADSYICPICKTEVDNPRKYGYRCPTCGFVSDTDLAKIVEPNKMMAGEYCEEFDRLRKSRVAVSFYKYGPARKNFGECRVDALEAAKRCIYAFERDHNTEHLVDAANYLMFRFKYQLPGEFFRETDSSESVGTVGTPINMER